MRRFGFHVSISGGIFNAPAFALLEGYKAFQFFPSSSRAWEVKDIGEVAAKKFVSISEDNDILPFAHIPYLCNPASPETEVIRKSKRMLVESMGICSRLKTRYIVVHLGSHKGKGIDGGISSILEVLKHALDSVKGVDILLENTSGYRNSVGSNFSEIGRIIDGIGSKRIGLCFDTCHAFAAGYDLRSEAGTERTVGEIDSEVGLERLKLVHLNDAKYPLGSRLDRHWHIGKGHIGRKGFVNLFRNKAFASGNFIMETPFNEEGDDKSNMRAVESILIEAEGKR